MALDQLIQLNNPAYFNYNTDELKVDPTNYTTLKYFGLLYANYDTNEDAVFAMANKDGTLGGSASVASGELDLTGGNAFVEYDPTNLDNFLNIGTVAIRWKPDYTGNAPAVQELFQSNVSTANRVHIRHNSNLIQCYIYDSVGVLVTSMSFAWTPSIIKYYELKLTFNLVTGEQRFYIDNVLEDTDTSTGNRTNNNLFRIGASGGMNSYIDSIIVFDEVINTPINWGNTPNTLYPTNNPLLHLNTSVVIIFADQLFDLLENVNKSGNDDVRYILSRNGNPVYWNGTAWMTSNYDITESNTIAELLQGKESFLTNGDGKLIGITWLFHSDTGDTTPQGVDLFIEWDVSAPIPTLTQHKVYGYIANPDGSRNDTPIKVTPSEHIIDTNLIVTKEPVSIEIFPNNTWEAVFYTENILFTELTWEFPTFSVKTNFLSGFNKFSDLTIIP